LSDGEVEQQAGERRNPTRLRQFLSLHSSSLPYLLKVGELGSIRQAAEALNIASSAVNRKILKIEKELGVSLFKRTVSGMTPTAAGALLLQHARATLTDYYRTVDEIVSRQGVVKGNVKIIGLGSFIDFILPSRIVRLCEDYPELTLKVVDESPGRIVDEVMTGNFDLAITFIDSRHQGLELFATIDVAVCAIMAADHPLARRKSVTLTECAEFSTFLFSDRLIIESLVESEFRRTGAEFRPRVVTNSMAVMRAGILSGLGIGFFTPIGFLGEIAGQRIASVPLVGSDLVPKGIGLYAAKGVSSSPPARIVLDFLSSEFKLLDQSLRDIESAQS
jgi:DNA-binding transcriptional LysR family regulator